MHGDGYDSAASPGWESSSNRRIPDLQSKGDVLTSFSAEGARLLISGSQVRALVRPPNHLQNQPLADMANSLRPLLHP